MAITPREAEFLEVLAAHVERHGIPPSYKEFGAALRLKSTSGIFLLARSLERKGYIRVLPRRARGIEMVRAKHHHAADCLCESCGGVRYRNSLKLVEAIKHDAPAQLKFFGLARLRIGKRAELLGVSLGDQQSTGSKTAPRTRTRAIPSTGGL